MSTSVPDLEIGPRPGLSTVADIVVAPGSAFARLRVVPTWGWAFLIATVLAVAGAFLVGPAVQHAMDVSLPAQLAANPQIAKLSPEQQQRQIAMALNISKTIARFTWVFVPVSLLLVALIQAVVMLIANAATRGAGTFKQFFALSMNVAIVGAGLYQIVLALIATVRGPGGFESTAEIYRTIPSLALLVPSAHGALAGFLAGFNVFYLWATALLAAGMTAIGRIPRGAAWATAIVMLLCAAGFLALGARGS